MECVICVHDVGRGCDPNSTSWLQTAPHLLDPIATRYIRCIQNAENVSTIILRRYSTSPRHPLGALEANGRSESKYE